MARPSKAKKTDTTTATPETPATETPNAPAQPASEAAIKAAFATLMPIDPALRDLVTHFAPAYKDKTTITIGELFKSILLGIGDIANGQSEMKTATLQTAKELTELGDALNEVTRDLNKAIVYAQKRSPDMVGMLTVIRDQLGKIN